MSIVSMPGWEEIKTSEIYHYCVYFSSLHLYLKNRSLPKLQKNTF